REDRRPEHVRRRRARPLRRGIDLHVLDELDVERPLEGEDDQHGQVERPRRGVDREKPERRQRLVQETQPGERLPPPGRRRPGGATGQTGPPWTRGARAAARRGPPALRRRERRWEWWVSPSRR